MKVIKLGFTGTRYGMTSEQLDALVTAFESLRQCGLVVGDAHEGWCVGADEQFITAVRLAMPHATIHHHPCDMKALQSKEPPQPEDIVHEEKPPLKRNQDIVDVCDLLIAAPREMEEVQRSGTWSTLRRAVKAGKDTILIRPDGSMSVGVLPQ